jgi:molybdate transport system substrate-binding protein
MRRTFRYLTVLAFFLNACGSAAAGSSQPRPSQTGSEKDGALIVFAAASLTDAFKEIGTAFEVANPGTSIRFNFAGSQTLRTQIEEGAPADVFASANTDQMDVLVADGMIAPDAPRIFLENQLVVILPPHNPAKVHSLSDLGRAGVKLDLAAPDVPVGSYARRALERMNEAFGGGFEARVLANVVSEEDNVKQVVTKVQLGEADAGFVYTSDARAAPHVGRIAIPADLNVTAQYPIARLGHAANLGLAEAFADYVLSAEGQAILAKWGFQPVR